LRTTAGLFILLFTTAAAYAQLPSGIWVSSHKLRLGTYLETEGMEKLSSQIMKNVFAKDSIYSEGGLILVSDSNGSARLLGDIRSQFIEARNLPNDNKLIFGRDTSRIDVLNSSRLLLIEQFTDSIRYENHFHRLPNSDLNKGGVNSMSPLPGAHLQLNVTDTLSHSYQLDIMDERKVVVTAAKSGKPFTTIGTWHSRWVGNTLLFSFFDNHFDQMQLYTFYKESANALIGSTFKHTEALKAEPSKLLATLNRLDVPDSSQIAVLRDGIIGSWAAINDPLFYDPAIEFGFLSYQSFEITFSTDSSFAMTKSGTILKHGDSIPLEEITRGKWEVSPTGNYLILTPPNANPFYFFIEKAGPRQLDIYYFMKTLSEFPNYNVFENRRVELRR